LEKYGIHFNINKSNSKVILWGTGNAMREFLHVDDMAFASIFVLELDKVIYQKNTKTMLSHINIGTGVDVTIKDLADRIKNILSYKGQISFDNIKSDGTPRKLIDASRLNKIGWSSNIELEKGIQLTYKKYLSSI